MILHKNWIINSVLSVLIAVTCLLGDKLVQATRDPLVKAAIDSSTHALIGFFSAAVVLTEHREKIHLAVACMVMSSLIDVDHFVMAKSFKLSVRIIIAVVINYAMNSLKIVQ